MAIKGFNKEFPENRVYTNYIYPTRILHTKQKLLLCVNLLAK